MGEPVGGYVCVPLLVVDAVNWGRLDEMLREHEIKRVAVEGVLKGMDMVTWVYWLGMASEGVIFTPFTPATRLDTRNRQSESHETDSGQEVVDDKKTCALGMPAFSEVQTRRAQGSMVVRVIQ